MKMNKPNVINMSDPSTIFDYSELDCVKNVLTNLIETHWEKILHAINESEGLVGGVNIALRLDHRGLNSRHIKARIAYAVRTSDEAETYVKDPAQTEFGI